MFRVHRVSLGLILLSSASALGQHDELQVRRRTITSQPRTFDNQILFARVDDLIVRSDRFTSASVTPGDFDGDGDVDLLDYNVAQICHSLSGPSIPIPPACEPFDIDGDADMDLEDVAAFLEIYTGHLGGVVVEAGELIPVLAPEGDYYSGEPGTWGNNALNGWAAQAGYTQDDLWYEWALKSQPEGSGQVIVANAALPATAYTILAPVLIGEYVFKLTVTNLITLESAEDAVTLELVECFRAADCDDGHPCTIDSCDPARGCEHTDVVCASTEECDPYTGVCEPISCVIDDDCDDGDVCNGLETCVDQTCLAGTTLDCDDGDNCTIDSCDPASGCQHTDVVCGPAEECDPDTGVCEAIPCEIDEDCDDGDVCNALETCTDGTCAPGTAPDCDDADNCTADSCDPVDGCSNAPVECPSHQRCNLDTGECEFIPCKTSVDCDDGMGCTIDTCAFDNTCRNTERVCDDSNFCNGLEYCEELTPQFSICRTPGNPCTEEPFVFCDDMNDRCIECWSNTYCDDGLQCNGPEACVDGECVVGPEPCDDGVFCTDDACEEGAPTCTHTPNDDLCPQDAFFCNGPEVCDLLLDCVSDGDPCEPDESCNEYEDRCDECMTAFDCDDDVACTFDSCIDGQCRFLPINGACDDGEYCNGTEVCDLALGCISPGNPCDDGLDCTIDECVEASQSCTHTPDDALCFDDGLFCNGLELCDLVMGCISPGSPCLPTESCDDVADTCEPQATSWESDQLMLRRDAHGFVPPESYELDEQGDLTIARLGLSEAELQSAFPDADVTVHTTDVTLGVETDMYYLEEDLGGGFTSSRSLHVTIDAFNLSVSDDGGVLTATWTFDFTGLKITTDPTGTAETAWRYFGTRTGDVSPDGTVINWTSVQGSRCNVTMGSCFFPVALTEMDFPPGTWIRQ